MRWLLMCMPLHLLLAILMPSPWWVPDLTMAGLVFAIVDTPRQWLIGSIFAAAFTMVWAVRDILPLFAGWLILGGAIRWAIGQWDIEEPHLQAACIVFASLAMSSTALWLADLWSLEGVGWLLVRAVMTLMAVLLLQGWRKAVRIPVPRGSR